MTDINKIKRGVLEHLSVGGVPKRKLSLWLQTNYGDSFASSGKDRFKPSDVLVLMRREGLISEINALLRLTEAGRIALDSNPERRMARANVITKTQGVYLCPELGETCARPGAYDFKKAPSLYGNTRVPYKYQ